MFLFKLFLFTLYTSTSNKEITIDLPILEKNFLQEINKIIKEKEEKEIFFKNRNKTILTIKKTKTVTEEDVKNFFLQNSKLKNFSKFLQKHFLILFLLILIIFNIIISLINLLYTSKKSNIIIPPIEKKEDMLDKNY